MLSPLHKEKILSLLIIRLLTHAKSPMSLDQLAVALKVTADDIYDNITIQMAAEYLPSPVLVNADRKWRINAQYLMGNCIRKPILSEVTPVTNPTKRKK